MKHGVRCYNALRGSPNWRGLHDDLFSPFGCTAYVKRETAVENSIAPKVGPNSYQVVYLYPHGHDVGVFGIEMADGTLQEIQSPRTVAARRSKKVGDIVQRRDDVSATTEQA